MRFLPRPTIFSAAVLGALTAATPARLHPHVFAEARLDVTVMPDGAVGALRHLWRFDDLFSSTVLVEFDKNMDLELDDAELQEVSGTIFASLAEYNYFQIVTADGKDVAMAAPENLMANYEGDQLIILFESKPKEALPLAGTLAFGVYDPTFYTAIDFIEDENMAVENMPSGCARVVVRPDADEAIAQNQASLTEEFFNQPGGNDPSKLFATRLELTCAANG